jgi:hypothetical protein
VRIFASLDAAAAEDALGSIANQCRCELIKESLGVDAGISVVSGSGQGRNMQKFAVSVLVALLAVLIMVGKKKLHTAAACFCGCRRADLDLHAFRDRIYAAGY